MKKILVPLMILLIAGCGAVFEDDWNLAKEMCEPFGGIKKVYTRGHGAVCKNGLELDLLAVHPSFSLKEK